jgi:hypothetical protein
MHSFEKLRLGWVARLNKSNIFDSATANSFLVVEVFILIQFYSAISINSSLGV